VKQHIGSSPGKLILSGEHAVVYGHPAIAVPVSLRVIVTLTEKEGPLDIPEIDARLTQAWRSILPTSGLKVEIESTLPIGCGMGSSAAISIATLRALASYQGHSPDFDWLFEQGFVMERMFHGTPSGLDHAVCALEKPILYNKIGPTLSPISLPQSTLVVMHSNEPKKTSAMVERVRAQWPNNKSLLNQIGTLTQEIAQYPHCNPQWLGTKLTENHQLLRALGVSTPTLDLLVETALKHGALGAKLAGSGGGGIAFALVENNNPEPIQSAIENLGYKCFCLHT
jgi:mevalonate kinase